MVTTDWKYVISIFEDKRKLTGKLNDSVLVDTGLCQDVHAVLSYMVSIKSHYGLRTMQIDTVFRVIFQDSSCQCRAAAQKSLRRLVSHRLKEAGPTACVDSSFLNARKTIGCMIEVIATALFLYG